MSSRRIMLYVGLYVWWMGVVIIGLHGFVLMWELKYPLHRKRLSRRQNRHDSYDSWLVIKEEWSGSYKSTTWRRQSSHPNNSSLRDIWPLVFRDNRNLCVTAASVGRENTLDYLHCRLQHTTLGLQTRHQCHISARCPKAIADKGKLISLSRPT